MPHYVQHWVPLPSAAPSQRKTHDYYLCGLSSPTSIQLLHSIPSSPQVFNPLISLIQNPFPSQSPSLDKFPRKNPAKMHFQLLLLSTILTMVLAAPVIEERQSGGIPGCCRDHMGSIVACCAGQLCNINDPGAKWVVSCCTSFKSREMTDSCCVVVLGFGWIWELKAGGRMVSGWELRCTWGVDCYAEFSRSWRVLARLVQGDGLGFEYISQRRKCKNCNTTFIFSTI